MRFTLIFSIAVLLAACSTVPAGQNTVSGASTSSICPNGMRHAAFDIGSTGMKVRTACVVSSNLGAKLGNFYKFVPTAAGTTTEIELPSGEIRYGHKYDANGCFSKDVVDRSKIAVAEYLDKMKTEYSAQTISYRGAATAAFRRARTAHDAAGNLTCTGGKLSAQDLIAALNAQGINAIIADNSLEGELEFRGVVASATAVGTEPVFDQSGVVLVFGFGSTSTQLTAWDGNENNFKFVEGPGSGDFRNQIIKDIQGGNPAKMGCATDKPTCTPASLKWLEAKTAIAWAEKKVNRGRNSHAAFPAVQNNRMHGVGGRIMHLQLALDDTGANGCTKPKDKLGQTFTLDEAKRSARNKSEYGNNSAQPLCNSGGYETNEVSDVLLVTGVLSAMQPSEVKWVDSGVSYGLLVTEQWP